MEPPKEAWELLQDAVMIGTPNVDFSKLLARALPAPIKNRDVAGILALVMKIGLPTVKPALQLVETAFALICKQGSSLNWGEIVLWISRDFASLKPVKSPHELSTVLVALWRRVNNTKQPMPGAVFLQDGDLLALAVQCEDVQFDPNTWGCVPVVDALLRFATEEYNAACLQVLHQIARTRYPDLLLLSLIQCGKQKDEGLREELYAHLVPQLLHRANASNETEQQVAFRTLKQVWALNRELVLRGVLEVFPQEFEVLQIVLRLPNGLESVLALPTRYSLGACFFAFQEFDLENWLAERAMASGEPKQVFIRDVLGFIQAYYAAGKLSREFVAMLFRVIQVTLRAPPSAADAAATAAGEDEALLREVRAVLEQCRAVDPLLLSAPQPAAAASATTEAVAAAAAPPPPPYDDVEEQANARFQMIYSGEMKIDEAIAMLAKFKDSTDAREHGIFACMIHNLFDEYRFFHDYPEKELRITAILFGKLIQKQVVSSWTLSMAIKYVLDALRSSNEKNFSFGLLALRQFLPRLPTMLHVVDDLLQIPHLHQLMDPNMYYEIEQIKLNSSAAPASAAAVPPPPSQQQQPMATADQIANMAAVLESKPPAAAAQASAATAAAVSATLVRADESLALRGTEKDEALASFAAKLDRMMPPPPGGAPVAALQYEPDPSPPDAVVADQIQFLINNLAQDNLEEKVTQMKRILLPSMFPWVANILVRDRASTQLNFQSLYMAFLDKLGEAELTKQVRMRTLRLIRQFLYSDKVISNHNERAVLKNLGGWLGLLTLAKNKPLLHVELDLKELILDGYERGWLIAIVPFAAKILEGANDSRVFSPQHNPWMRGILGCLAEIYRLPGVKLNLNFEMEVLCRTFKGGSVMEMSTVVPTNLLPQRIKPKLVGNPDFTNKLSASSSAASAAAATTTSMSQQQPGGGVAASAAVPSSLSAPPVPSSSSGAGGAFASSSAERAASNASIPFAQPNAGAGGGGSSSFAGQQQQYYSAAAGGAGSDNFETMIPGVHIYVFVNVQLELFIKYPELKNLVPVAFDRAIREIIQPAVERSVTIATYTTKELITKDFAMEPNELKMQRAAHLMCANLAGALALMTCKELLKTSMAIHLRQLFGLNPNISQEDAELAEVAIQTCCDENLELGCMLIEKAATEKAARDIDDALEMAYQSRIDHRATSNEPFFDASVFNTGGRYPAVLPAGIRPSPREGGLSQEHLQVYDAFKYPAHPTMTGAGGDAMAARLAAAPQQPAAATAAVAAAVPANLSAHQALERYKQVVSVLDLAVQKLLLQPGFHDLPTSLLPLGHEVLVQLGMVRTIVQSTMFEARFDVAVVLAQSVFKRLYDGSPTDKLRLSVQVGALEAISSALEEPGLKNKITEWVIVSIESGKLNVTVTCALIDAGLVNTLALDNLLAELLLLAASNQPPQGNVLSIVLFAMELIQRCLVQTRTWQVNEAQKVLIALRKFAANGNHTPPAGLSRLFGDVADVIASFNQTAAAAAAAAAAPVASGMNPAAAAVAAAQQAKDALPRLVWSRNADIPPVLRDAAQQALQLWLECTRDGISANAFLGYLMDKQLVRTDAMSEVFFYVLTELCIESYLSLCAAPVPDEESTDEYERQMRAAYFGIDNYCTMVVFLVKVCESGLGKCNIAAHALENVARVMAQDLAQRAELGNELAFDQRAYFRLLLNLQRELLSLPPPSAASNGGDEMLAVFAEALHSFFAPERCPGFCFAWLELVSHKSFLPRLLRLEGEGGWGVLHQLLLDLFRFLEPYLGRASLTPSVRQLYKGTLRVLLVLLHDFPEFLCFYHFSLCNVIPPTCVQLRNLILSAFPRTMRLPDPFTQNLKVDLLAEIEMDPKILSNVTIALEYASTGNLKHELDTFLISTSRVVNSTSAPLLRGLKDRLLCEHERTGTWDCLNALVLYVGAVSIARTKAGAAGDVDSFQISKDVYQTLALELEGEAQYMFLNAIANHLRFPNSHTHFFSCVILGLFKDVPELVTRVLLERLIVHRPHPWGLLVTFIELMKNPRYSFWEHSFTRCTPEIQKVFESVATSCGAVQQRQAVN